MNVLLLSFLPLTVSGCFLYNVNYSGQNLNGAHQVRTNDAVSCQNLCKKDANCHYWSWFSPDYFDAAYQFDCYLKADDGAILSQKGVTSGPENCGDQSCCDQVFLESTGMADFYQGDSLGHYYKIGNSQDGRNIYKQGNGEKYLYYLNKQAYWMVGNNAGSDDGVLMNRGTSYCPEDLTHDWAYWADWMEEWSEDWTMTSKCEN